MLNLSRSHHRLRRIAHCTLLTIQDKMSTLRLHSVEVSDIDALHSLLDWLCLAQDCSQTHDYGVARHYSLLSNWGSSYPETTGYIIKTFLSTGRLLERDDLVHRAKRMLDWLVDIQLKEGGFTGSTIANATLYPYPVAFNTGQILIGLANGAKFFGSGYIEATRRAAKWLMSIQSLDGSWTAGQSPVASCGAKTFHTHIAYGMFEAARATDDDQFAQAGLQNIKWALSKQRDNGWFEDCCLTDSSNPLTHTIGYALRGILEGFVYFKYDSLLRAAIITADGVLKAVKQNGALPGRLDSNWSPSVKWVCLTGSAQIAICFQLLHDAVGLEKYQIASRALIDYIKRTINYNGKKEIKGAVKGSQPINGEYCSFSYPNWAAKFTVDAIMNTILNEGE